MKKTTTQFGTVLKAARRKTGKTLGDVADAVGVTAAYLSDIERGNRLPLAPDRISLAAKFLSLDENYLLAAAARDRQELRLPIGNLNDRQVRHGLTLLRGVHELPEEEHEAFAAAVEDKLKRKGKIP
jgi:transcriptional regulator with XRE-family HTH domain